MAGFPLSINIEWSGVMESAAFLGKTLFLRNNWHFKEILNESFNKKIVNERFWFISLNSGQPFSKYSIFVAQELANFPRLYEQIRIVTKTVT